MRRSKGGVVVWLTGLSGAGKSTLVQAVAPRLRAHQRKVEVLDGDVVRAHISTELGFSRVDRDRNVARIAFIASLLARNDVAVLVAAISPYRAARNEARALIGDFLEVHVARPLEECIKYDVKGLYAKALAGEIVGFTGISDPYEEPLAPELRIDTSVMSVARATECILAKLVELGYVDKGILNITAEAKTLPPGATRARAEPKASRSQPESLEVRLVDRVEQDERRGEHADGTQECAPRAGGGARRSHGAPGAREEEQRQDGEPEAHERRRVS